MIFSNKLEIHLLHEVTQQVFRCTWITIYFSMFSSFVSCGLHCWSLCLISWLLCSSFFRKFTSIIHLIKITKTTYVHARKNTSEKYKQAKSYTHLLYMPFTWHLFHQHTEPHQSCFQVANLPAEFYRCARKSEVGTTKTIDALLSSKNHHQRINGCLTNK